MSLRTFGGKVLRHGVSILNQAPKGKLINNKPHVRLISNCVKPLRNNLSQKNDFVRNNKYRVFRNIGVQISQKARQVLFDDVLNRVQNSQIFQKASKNGLYGHSAPLLSLVGVAAIGQGFLTKDEELEGICWELRQCMSKVQWNRDLNYQQIVQQDDNNALNLTGFTFGAPIAKGSNAVVYSVELSPNVVASSAEELIKNRINFPLALKMMFNYDIQSNSLAILKGMYRETVPSPVYFNNQGISDIEYEFLNASRHLPAHPNIVKILSVFTDFVPELEQCREMYPAALPKRINPHGEGRNMSLFILMKKYNLNLDEFLNDSTEKPSLRTSIILLTQILEGVVHLTANNIAHRDLKADNILLDLNTDSRCPLAVISDFGCCLAEKSCDLSIPYTNFNVDKGGNTALMAPEIITKRPGPFTRLNYHKSDLWAVGAIAYEVFGYHNPFYGDRGRRLNSSNYKEEDLPRLNNNMPKIITRLISNLLKRDPNDRLDAEIAATVCQLFLWAPKTWMQLLKTGGKFPNYQEILEWLLNLAAKILYERKRDDLNHSDEILMCFAEYSLISTFLCRVKLQHVKLALLWIQEEDI